MATTTTPTSAVYTDAPQQQGNEGGSGSIRVTDADSGAGVDVVGGTMPLVLPSLVNVYDRDVPTIGPVLEAMEFHREENPASFNDKMWAYKHGSGAPLVLNQSESVRQFFDSIREKKFATVSVLGPTRTGKSTLLNYAIQILQGTNTDPFVTSDNLKFGCTSGIWFFPSLINIPGCEIPVLLVDVEGLYAVDPMSSRRKSDVDQYYFTRLWILDLADAISDFKSNRQSDILFKKNCPSVFAYIAQNFGQNWTLEQDDAFWTEGNEYDSKLPPEFEKLFPNSVKPFKFFTLPPCSYEGRPDVPTHADFIAKLKQIFVRVGTLTTSPLRLTVLEGVNGKLETPQMVKVVDFYCDSKRLEALDAVFSDVKTHFSAVMTAAPPPVAPSFVQVAIGLAMKSIEHRLGEVVGMKGPTVEGKTRNWDLARFKREVEDRITAESEALTNKFRQEAATFCAGQVAIAVRDFFLHTTDLTSSEALMAAAHKKMQELTSQLQRFDPVQTEAIDTFLPAVNQRLNEHTNAATVSLHVVMRRVAEPFFQALGKNLPEDINVYDLVRMYHSELFDSNENLKVMQIKCSDVNQRPLQESELLNAYNNESKNIHPACRLPLPFVTEQLRRLHNTLAAEGAKALHVMQWVGLEFYLRCVMTGGGNGPPLPIKSCEDFQTIQRWTGADILQLVWAPSFECLKGQILDRFMQHGARLQQWLLDKQVDVNIADTIVQIFCESVAVIFSKIPLPACFDLTVVFPRGCTISPDAIAPKFSLSLSVQPVHLGTIENLPHHKMASFQFSLNPLDDGRKAQELKRHLEKLPFGPQSPSAEALHWATKFFCQRVEYIWTFFEPKCKPETAAITGYKTMVFETTGEYPRDARIVIDNNRTFLAFPLPFSKDLGIALSLRFPASIGALELCPQVRVTAPSINHLFRFLFQARQPIIDVSSSSCSPTDGSSGEFVVTVISTDNLFICAGKQREITVTLLPPSFEVQPRPIPDRHETLPQSIKRVPLTNDDRFENLNRYTTPSLEFSVLSKPWDSFTWRKTFNKYAQRCIDNNTPVWRDELIVHLQILSAGFTLHALNPSSPGVYFLIEERSDENNKAANIEAVEDGTTAGSPAALMAEEMICSKEEDEMNSNRGLLCGVFHPPTKALSMAHYKLEPLPQHPALNSATEVFIVNMDCLHVAQQLMQQFPGELTAVLNMANSTTPGGGFENGKSAQEEDLCMRTSLFPALKQIGYPLPLCGTIFTRDVTVFRDTSLTGFQFLTTPWTVNVISAAALHNVDNKFTVRDPRTGEVFLSPSAAMITRFKLEQLLNTAAMYNVKQLVLGAIGCGAFNNPPDHVAAIFKEVLQQYAGCFSRVYFAILESDGSSATNGKCRAFAKKFDETGVTTRREKAEFGPAAQITQAVGPYVMLPVVKPGFIPLSHTGDYIDGPAICGYGGGCTNTSAGHFASVVHPPPCLNGTSCTCTSAIHQHMWLHQVKCPLGGTCPEFFSPQRDEHCLHFVHPPQCPKMGHCTERNENTAHMTEFLHVPECEHGSRCEKFLAHDESHMNEARHLLEDCSFGYLCNDVYQRSHLAKFYHPFNRPCEHTPYSCDIPKSNKEHHSLYAHMCERGVFCDRLGDPSHTKHFLHSDVKCKFLPACRNLHEDHLGSVAHPGIPISRPHCTDLWCTDNSESHLRSKNHSLPVLPWSPTRHLSLHDPAEFAQKENPEAVGTDSTTPIRVAFFDNIRRWEKHCKKLLKDDSILNTSNFKNIVRWFRAQQPVHMCSVDLLTSMLDIQLIASAQQFKSLWQDPSSVVHWFHRCAREYGVLLVRSLQPSVSEKCIQLLETKSTTPDLDPEEAAKIQGSKNLFSHTPIMTLEDEEKLLGASQVLKKCNATLHTKMSDTITTIVNAVAKCIAEAPGINYSKDKGLRTDFTVFASMGPNTGHYGDKQVCIVLRREIMHHPDFYMLPLAATAYPTGWYTFASGGKICLDRRSWMGKSKGWTEGGETAFTRAKFHPCVKPDTWESTALGPLDWAVAESKEWVCRVSTKQTIEAHKVDVNHVRNLWMETDSHGVTEAHLPGYIPFGYVDTIFIKKSVALTPHLSDMLKHFHHKLVPDVVKASLEFTDSRFEHPLIVQPRGFYFVVEQHPTHETFVPVNLHSSESHKSHLYFKAHSTTATGFNLCLSNTGDILHHGEDRHAITIHIPTNSEDSLKVYRDLPAVCEGAPPHTEMAAFNNGINCAEFVHYYVRLDYNANLVTVEHWGPSRRFNMTSLNFECPDSAEPLTNFKFISLHLSTGSVLIADLEVLLSQRSMPGEAPPTVPTPKRSPLPPTSSTVDGCDTPADEEKPQKSLWRRGLDFLFGSTDSSDLPKCPKATDCLDFEKRPHCTEFVHVCLWGSACNLVHEEEHCKFYIHMEKPVCTLSPCPQLDDPEHRRAKFHKGFWDFLLPCRDGPTCKLRTNMKHRTEYYHEWARSAAAPHSTASAPPGGYFSRSITPSPGSASTSGFDDTAPTVHLTSIDCSSIAGFGHGSRDQYVVFLMDATGSMGSYISSCKQNIVSCIQAVEKHCQDSSTKSGYASASTIQAHVGFVGYRDIGDEGHPQPCPFSPSKAVQDFLASVAASGGGDTPEDIVTGLDSALAFSWGTGCHTIVVAGDAPPHKWSKSTGGDSHPVHDQNKVPWEDRWRTALMALELRFIFVPLALENTFDELIAWMTSPAPGGAGEVRALLPKVVCEEVQQVRRCIDDVGDFN
ncbi:TIGR02452 family protein [Pelomyxa schiedti]|nr:TIGR02452 family protein [Pelomyxa schiedti]